MKVHVGHQTWNYRDETHRNLTQRAQTRGGHSQFQHGFENERHPA